MVIQHEGSYLGAAILLKKALGDVKYQEFKALQNGADLFEFTQENEIGIKFLKENNINFVWWM